MQEIFIQEGEAIIRAHILARIQNKVQIQIIDILGESRTYEVGREYMYTGKHTDAERGALRQRYMEALLPEKILEIQNLLRAKSYDEYREKYEKYFWYLQKFLSLKIWLSAPSIPGNDGDVILIIYYFRMLQDFLNHLGDNRLDTELKQHLSVFYLNNKDEIQYLLDAQKITEEGNEAMGWL